MRFILNRSFRFCVSAPTALPRRASLVLCCAGASSRRYCMRLHVASPVVLLCGLIHAYLNEYRLGPRAAATQGNRCPRFAFRSLRVFFCAVRHLSSLRPRCAGIICAPLVPGRPVPVSAACPLRKLHRHNTSPSPVCRRVAREVADHSHYPCRAASAGTCWRMRPGSTTVAMLACRSWARTVLSFFSRSSYEALSKSLRSLS